jgi:adenylosuccinate synthase
MASPDVVLLLSGPVSVGKTTLRDLLMSNHQFGAIRSSAYLRDVAAKQAGGTGRLDLQELGDALDQRTDYRWVVDSVALPAIAAEPGRMRWLFDAVRKKRQVEHFRAAFGAAVFHLHLDAPEDVLRTRYELRLLEQGGPVEGAYDRAVAHDNEQQSRGLIRFADATVQTYPGSSEEVLAQALAAIRRKLPAVS